MFATVLFILLVRVNSEKWDCTITNNAMSCQDGECQHRIRGKYDYTYQIKTTGKKVNDVENPNQEYCPIIIESNSELQGIDIWVNFDGITVNDNVNALFKTGDYSVVNNFTFHQNSFVIIDSNFSIGCLIIIDGYRKSNTPLIPCFDCSYLDLHRQNSTQRPSYWMNVTYENDNCVDIISLYSPYPITNAFNDNKLHGLNVIDFPIYNLGLYLLSNQKLIRYCPGKLDNNVECSISKY